MLPSLALAFIAGLLLGSQIPYFPLSTSVAFLVIALVGVTLERFALVPVRSVTWCYGMLLGGVIYWTCMVGPAVRDPGATQLDESFMELTGRIVAPVQQSADRSLMIVRLDEVTSESWSSKRVRLTWRVPERQVFHGDRIGFRARLRTPTGSLNPGGFDYAAYLERQGIDAVATVTGPAAVRVLQSGSSDGWWAIWNQIDRWRGRIRSAALQSLSQPALGLYLGIVIGDRGYLDGVIRDEFMVTGTIHLLSISGSHLGLVAIVVFVALRRGLLLLPGAWLLRLSRRMTATRMAALGTIAPVVGYACLAGAELATLRSLIMVLVALITLWLGQERRIFHALAAAAMVLLLHDPQAVFDISFQLSFVSVLAIALWMVWSREARTEDDELTRLVAYRLWRWVLDAVAMSGIVTIATLPLVAFYFNQVPWLGVITNLVAVPITGAGLVPLGLGAGVWQLLAGGTTLPMAGVMQWLFDGFVSAVRLAALIPGGEWHVAAPTLATMMMFYGCLAMAVWLREGRIIRGMAIGCVAVILLLWVWSPRLWLDGDRFRVTVLDVGQGDSTVVELPDGKVIVIDGGATYERFDMGRGVVAPYLWNRGIRTIDHLVGTHPQLDHLGGLTWLVRHMSVRQYWGSGEQREELFYRRFLEALGAKELVEQVPHEGQELVSGGPCRLLVLNPVSVQSTVADGATTQKSGSALNNRSVVTRLECGSHSFLFAADVEREALSRMERHSLHRSVDVVKVPHHGAASSLDQEWLASVRPEYAIVSAGRHNPYGHPNPTVLEAYSAQNIKTFRTDEDGGVWIAARLSTPTLSVWRTRDGMLQPTRFSSCLWSCEQANWGRVWRRWRDE
jgi:competence protein ComEC